VARLTVGVTPLLRYLMLSRFVQVPTEIRIKRLHQREARHFGAEAVSPGGWRHQETEDSIEWASLYDDGTREGPNLRRHQTWLDTLSCPVLRLDGTRATKELVAEIIATLPRQRGRLWVICGGSTVPTACPVRI